MKFSSNNNNKNRARKFFVQMTYRSCRLVLNVIGIAYEFVLRSQYSAVYKIEFHVLLTLLSRFFGGGGMLGRHWGILIMRFHEGTLWQEKK